LILVKAFEYIFPVRGQMIFTSCVVMFESDEDITFRENAMKAFSELEAIYDMSRDVAALEQAIRGAGPLSLQKHLKEHYQ